MISNKASHSVIVEPGHSTGYTIAHLLGRPVLFCVRGACVIVIVAMPIAVVTAVVWVLVTTLS